MSMKAEDIPPDKSVDRLFQEARKMIEQVYIGEDGVQQEAGVLEDQSNFQNDFLYGRKVSR